MRTIEKILVPVDFSPCSDAALRYALAIADVTGAEVELLHVWSPADSALAMFAETPQGIAMEERLSAAEADHAARVSGRLEFGDPSRVILDILGSERFDLVVMGATGDGRRPAPEEGHVATHVATTAPCKVVRLRTTSEPCAA